MPIAYRYAEPHDRAFIVSSWASSFRLAHAAGLIAMEDWSAVMHPQIEKVLDRPDAITVVAHEDEDSDHVADLYGFVCYEPRASAIGPPALVFYCYVKQPYRLHGIARGLLSSIGIDESQPFDFACRTSVVSRLVRKMPLARWQPLRARFPKAQPNGVANGR